MPDSGREFGRFVPAASPQSSHRRWLVGILPAAVSTPPLAISVLYVVAFTIWTTWMSFTDSTMMPSTRWAGLQNYRSVLEQPKVRVAYTNLLIYGAGFILFASLLGLLLAVLLDRRIRAESLFRGVFLYPMALSFVVSGTVWSWLLNPSLGIQHLVQSAGWTSFRFDWLVSRDRAIYTIIVVAVWQAAGFAMALFTAGLRSVGSDVLKAAAIDGAGPVRTYVSVVFPSMAPIFLTTFVVLFQIAIKTFDLVWVMTGGGPGIATALPSLVVYDYIFQRGQLARGAAAAVLMLACLVAVFVPYRLWIVSRQRE